MHSTLFIPQEPWLGPVQKHAPLHVFPPPAKPVKLSHRQRDAAYAGKWLQEDDTTPTCVVLTRGDETVHVRATGARVYRGNALSRILSPSELSYFLEA
jgi:hypothetical protein